MKSKCADCRYWDPDFYDARATCGACMRYPPAVVLDNETHLPETDPDHWCGEYEFQGE